MNISASLNKGWKSACLFVTSPMTGCKDKKHSLIGPGKFQRTNLARTGFWKWNRSCDWLITVKECGSVVSSRFFGGSTAWHPKKRLRRRLSWWWQKFKCRNMYFNPKSAVLGFLKSFAKSCILWQVKLFSHFDWFFLMINWRIDA